MQLATTAAITMGCFLMSLADLEGWLSSVGKNKREMILDKLTNSNSNFFFSTHPPHFCSSASSSLLLSSCQCVGWWHVVPASWHLRLSFHVGTQLHLSGPDGWVCLCSSPLSPDSRDFVSLGGFACHLARSPSLHPVAVTPSLSHSLRFHQGEKVKGLWT